MIGYMARQYVTKDDVRAVRMAIRIVDRLDDDANPSCHDVAALVGKKLGIEPTRGYYGLIEHSWIELPSGHILDVYAPGRLPMVQLVHARGTLLPENPFYSSVPVSVYASPGG